MERPENRLFLALLIWDQAGNLLDAILPGKPLSMDGGKIRMKKIDASFVDGHRRASCDVSCYLESLPETTFRITAVVIPRMPFSFVPGRQCCLAPDSSITYTIYDGFPGDQDFVKKAHHAVPFSALAGSDTTAVVVSSLNRRSSSAQTPALALWCHRRLTSRTTAARFRPCFARIFAMALGADDTNAPPPPEDCDAISYEITERLAQVPRPVETRAAVVAAESLATTKLATADARLATANVAHKAAAADVASAGAWAERLFETVNGDVRVLLDTLRGQVVWTLRAADTAIGSQEARVAALQRALCERHDLPMGTFDGWPDSQREDSKFGGAVPPGALTSGLTLPPPISWEDALVAGVAAK